MKIAISATGNNLEATIDERFGRCPYFIILETDDMSYDVLDNGNADLTTSAGIQAASFVASTGAEVVITGNCGPKAMQVFAATPINIILGQHGVVKDVVEEFKSGALRPSTRENVSEKYGVTQSAPPASVGQPDGGGSAGRGMGGGGGRGMGGGGGRGMGRRCQSATGTSSPGGRHPAGKLSRDQEIAQLQQQAGDLNLQMEAIQQKIKSLA